MSSNCPPQLQLSIQPNTNNFKRSFEQFGVDLGSPVGSTDAGGSGNNGNDRNKRARSSSSFSESSESAGSSTIVSGSNSSSSSMNMSREDRVGTSSGRPIIVLDPGVPLVPPRIPTPLIEDIDMADYVEESRRSPRAVPAASPTGQEQHRTPAADSYRLSLERFNAFESEMSLLRRSYPPEPLSRPPTPPPTLPPISISTNNVFGSTSTTILDSSSLSVDPTREEQSTEEGSESAFHNTPFRFLPLSSSHELPRGAAAESQPERHYQMQNGFRVHLDSALERLRSSSPLALSVGVGVAQPEPEEEQYEAEEEEEIVAEMLSRTAGPEPPTLPPIPSVATATEGEDWNDRVPFLNNEDDETSGATANAASPSTTNPWIARWQNPFPTPTRRAPSATTHPSLRDHPLPSPILRDLHSWMEEREITGTPPTSLWMSSADAAMSTRGVSESRDDANRNSLEDGNTGLTSHNLGPSVSDGRWDARHPQPVLFATSGSSTIAPSVIRNMRRTYTNSNGTFSEPVGSWVSEDTPSYLFANPTSLSFARNTADQETLSSLDHGNNPRLGFGPRVLPRMNTSDSNPLNGRATSHSTTPSSRHSQTAANSNTEDASRRVNLSPAVSNLSDNNVTSSRRFSLPRLSAQDIDRPWYGGLVPQFNLHQPTFQHAAPFNDGSSEAQHDSATAASPALSLRQDARHQERTNDNHSHPSTFQYAVPYDDGSSEAQRGAAALSAPASRQDAPRQERADRSTRSSTFQYAVPFNDGSRETERGRPVSPVSTSRQDASSRQERANSDVRSSDPPSTVLPWETVPLDTMDGIDDPHPMIWYRSEYGIGLPPRRRSLHGQSRLGTSTSLVAENAAEARRQADYANVQRAREMSHERTQADTFNSILAGNTTPRSSQDEQDAARMRSSTTGRWQADELGWPHRRNPYIFPFERRRNPSPDSPSAEMESATSSAVEPPMMGIGSGVYPRRSAHRQDDRPHLPLDTSAISDMPELNSPNEAAALRSFLRRELEALERSSLSSSAHANWNRMHGEPAHFANTPQRSRPPSPRSRESVADRLRSRIESLTDSSIPMEGVVETSPLETRGNTNAAASTNRGRNNEPFRYLDGNPRNTQTRPSVAPSLPSPDLGASFDAPRRNRKPGKASVSVSSRLYRPLLTH
ncbi:hypothetical protein CPC08DRAFT_496595 [Agrocybe pediades]|nr:hypothetical protein CPC08DRAFT_496595 [Agrocybe pediades]